MEQIEGSLDPAYFSCEMFRVRTVGMFFCFCVYMLVDLYVAYKSLMVLMVKVEP